MAKFLPTWAAATVAIFVASAAGAMTDQYAAGKTKLAVTEDGYAFEIRDPLVNPGNSLRLYARPRNGNCTGASYDQDRHALTMHDNPMCDSSKWGWVSLDVPSLSAILNDADKKIDVGAQIGGTLKTYDVGFTATVDSSGQAVIVGGMRSTHH